MENINQRKPRAKNTVALKLKLCLSCNTWRYIGMERGKEVILGNVFPHKTALSHYATLMDPFTTPTPSWSDNSPQYHSGGTMTIPISIISTGRKSSQSRRRISIIPASGVSHKQNSCLVVLRSSETTSFANSHGIVLNACLISVCRRKS